MVPWLCRSLTHFLLPLSCLPHHTPEQWRGHRRCLGPPPEKVVGWAEVLAEGNTASLRSTCLPQCHQLAPTRTLVMGTHLHSRLPEGARCYTRVGQNRRAQALFGTESPSWSLLPGAAFNTHITACLCVFGRSFCVFFIEFLHVPCLVYFMYFRSGRYGGGGDVAHCKLVILELRKRLFVLNPF